jgi:hypothetical protein
MDLREQLDRELSDTPHAGRDLSEILLAGRRAVRRRRTAAGVTAVAAAAVVVGIGWTLTLGGETPQVVNPPTETDTVPVDKNLENDCHEISGAELGSCRSRWEPILQGPGRSPVRRDPGVQVVEVIENPLESAGFNAAYEVDDNGARAFVLFEQDRTASMYPQESADMDLSTWIEEVKSDIEAPSQNNIEAPSQNNNDRSSPPAQFNPDGELVLTDGAEVVQRIEDPLGQRTVGKSLGLAVEHDGTTTWLALTWTPGSQTIASSPAQEDYATLEDWVESWVAQQQGRDAHALVEFNPNGTLRPLAGVEIVEQRTDVDMDASPNVRDEIAAVAQLWVDGEPWFVVGFGNAARPDFQSFNTPKAGETLDDFIAYYQAQNTGEGIQ